MEGCENIYGNIYNAYKNKELRDSEIKVHTCQAILLHLKEGKVQEKQLKFLCLPNI
ncbi:protein of unknown function [Bartonella clarridgeiae 73]|uniref:Uncharacterized protein n=1 Tax=Bartonella clarridgeiae (strain CCUG 45776 / CIP 104772 / 73) TaxID=696125 RepID=E6YHV2_BARC7|nr:protein of unknown function [Bartonella clarridgeiae 73]